MNNICQNPTNVASMNARSYVHASTVAPRVATATAFAMAWHEGMDTKIHGLGKSITLRPKEPSL